MTKTELLQPALIARVAAQIRRRFVGESSGHDWYHIQRVWKLTQQVAAQEGAKREIAELGALVHDIADVPALLDDSVKLVVTGHSHKPLIEWRGNTLYLNPGSAGRRRFKLPVTLALLEVSSDAMEPWLVQLLD